MMEREGRISHGANAPKKGGKGRGEEETVKFSNPICIILWPKINLREDSTLH